MMKITLLLQIIFMMIFSYICVSCICVSAYTTTTDDTISGTYGYTRATLLNQDPDPAEPGKYVEIRWKVEKFGNKEVKDIVYHLEAEYPFFFDESDTPEKHLYDWKGFSDDEEYYILYYKLRVDDDALEDTYTMKLKSKNGFTQGVWYEDEYDIRVADKNISELVLGTLTTSPTKLVADTDEAEVSVEVQNIGDGDAQNAIIEISLPEGFTPTYGYSDRVNLGTISAGDSETATFYVDVAVAVIYGDYDTEVTIDYKEADDDDNVYKTLILPLKIPILGKPVFEIQSVKVNPNVPSPGSSVELLITIKNIGNKEGESVSLRAYKESSQPFDFEEKSDFIGKLKPGESGEALLKFDVDEIANEKIYHLDLEVRSIYNEEVLTEEEVIQIKVQNGKRKGFLAILNMSSVVGIIIMLIIVVGGLFIYNYLLKRR